MKEGALLLLGVIAGLGASFSGLGGGFLVVPLLIALGFTAQRAVGTSFVAILIIALASMIGHARLQSVDWKSGVLLGLGGVVGAQIGPHLLRSISTAAFQKIFALVLVGLAGWMFFKK